MSGTVAVIVQVMPESPTSDLAAIVRKGEQALVDGGAMNVSYEEQPIAFGLKALYFKFAWPEEKDTELIEKALGAVQEVSSVKITDYRRAFG